MKRSLLDITQKMFRKIGKTSLIPKDLSNTAYSIWEAKGWKFVDVLREIEYRVTQDRLSIYINTQSINPTDYEVEEGITGLLIKFKKENFEYTLDSDDYIEIEGDIEYNA
jgi:hypothetical protein